MKKIKFNDKEFKYDQAILKSYNGKKYKLICFKKLLTSGLDKPKSNRNAKCTVNDSKLDNNISRARSKIYDYAICNEWQHFVTLTVNPKKHNPKDLKAIRQSLTKDIQNKNINKEKPYKYLLVPEEHKKGGYHFHGLMTGIPPEELKEFTLDMTLPYKLRKKLLEGRKLYSWTPYTNEYGWCVIEPVINHEAVSKYITKYIKKSLAESITELGQHLYYVSRGLEKSKNIKKGTMSGHMDPDFENDYLKIKWIDPKDLNLALSLIV